MVLGDDITTTYEHGIVVPTEFQLALVYREQYGANEGGKAW